MTSWLGRQKIELRVIERGNYPRYEVQLVNDNWCVVDTEKVPQQVVEEFDYHLDAEDYANYLNINGG